MAKNLTAVFCVDECMGMMFNHRRQSKDRVQRERLLALLGGKRLWMSVYSGKLYGDADGVCAHEAFSDMAQDGDALFFEDTLPVLDGVERVILYKWNEHYPSDVRLPFDLCREGFVLKESEDFAGSSHEKITQEIYER